MRPHGKYAHVDATNPEAFAQCDRCGFWRNRTDLTWQIEWSGTRIYNRQILVCSDRCFDTPQEQLRTIVLPPDPPPVVNARVPDFEYEEQTPIIMQFAGFNEPPWGAGPGLIMCDETGTVPFVLQYLTSS